MPESPPVEGAPLPRAILKPRKAGPFYHRHPWVLEKAIRRVEGNPADGDEIDLYSDKNKFIARGLFNSRSRIRIRLFTWDAKQRIDADFFRRRLVTALELRKPWEQATQGGGLRLVYSEADGISGLIVDRYGEQLVLQPTSFAVAKRLPLMFDLLLELVRPRGLVVRAERSVVRAEGIELDEDLCWGETPEEVIIEQDGLRFAVDLRRGQKTGFYLDQRENRRVAADYLQGGKVLDVCCYSGGFSLYAAARGGAEHVLGIDSSERAIELARRNAELNGLSGVEFESRNVFDRMDELVKEGRRYSAVILDPPKFAGSRFAIDQALRAYHRLNRLAVELLEPGGILVTCSCSGHVQREDFASMLFGVAQKTKRNIQILEQRGASPDHPVSVTCPETEYLKCFICRAV